MFKASAIIKRPANTTPYTALDVIGQGYGLQVETATAAGTITTSGNALATIDGALVTGAPLAVSVAVLEDDTAAQWAEKVRNALNALAAITDSYTVSGTGDAIVLTTKEPAANDGDLNIDLDNDTSAGITGAPSSANTQAGSATSANAGSAVLEFHGIGSKAGSIKIESASLRIDESAIPAGMTTFRLYLYDSAPVAILDNAVWALSNKIDRRGLLGYIDLGTVLDLGATLFVQANNIGLCAKLADGQTSIYGQLVTTGAYTPVSATVHEVTLLASEL